MTLHAFSRRCVVVHLIFLVSLLGNRAVRCQVAGLPVVIDISGVEDGVLSVVLRDVSVLDDGTALVIGYATRVPEGRAAMQQARLWRIAPDGQVEVTPLPSLLAVETNAAGDLWTSQSWDISRNGEYVVGNSASSRAGSEPTLWRVASPASPEGAGTLPDGRFSGRFHGVSDNGVACGIITNQPTGVVVDFSAPPEQRSYELLPQFPEQGFSFITEISADGEVIVGGGFAPSVSGGAMAWVRRGDSYRISALGGLTGRSAFAVSPSGQFAGGEGGDGRSPILWDLWDGGAARPIFDGDGNPIIGFVLATSNSGVALGAARFDVREVAFVGIGGVARELRSWVAMEYGLDIPELFRIDGAFQTLNEIHIVGRSVYLRLPFDGDADDDGVPDCEDNCALIANPQQTNSDSQAGGDLCDLCPRDPLDRCVFRGFLRGDSNADGVVDVSDGVFTLGYLFRGEAAPECLDTADADDNGTIDITDAIVVLSYLFIAGVPPRAPGPAQCGEDPSGDLLDCASYSACP